MGQGDWEKMPLCAGNPFCWPVILLEVANLSPVDFSLNRFSGLVAGGEQKGQGQGQTGAGALSKAD